MVSIGVAERSTVMLPTEDELYPPYHGYVLTETVKYKGEDRIPVGIDSDTMMKYRASYQVKLKEEFKLIKECFDS